jgi:hypothetical protein
VTAENVENIKKYAFDKVITHCPHCFNTIKNEYPQFDGNFEVLHHSVVIADLVKSGRIKPTKTTDQTVAFHDSCYLGRYNGIFEAPRDTARSVPGLRLIEMPRNRRAGSVLRRGRRADVDGNPRQEARQCHPGRGGARVQARRGRRGLSLLPCHGRSWAKGCGSRGDAQVKDISELVAESLE